MNTSKFFCLSTIALLLAAVPARADEGMWMVNAISKALVDKNAE